VAVSTTVTGTTVSTPLPKAGATRARARIMDFFMVVNVDWLFTIRVLYNITVPHSQAKSIISQQFYFRKVKILLQKANFNRKKDNNQPKKA
jgi:hypothetical protein